MLELSNKQKHQKNKDQRKNKQLLISQDQQFKEHSNIGSSSPTSTNLGKKNISNSNGIQQKKLYSFYSYFDPNQAPIPTSNQLYCNKVLKIETIAKKQQKQGSNFLKSTQRTNKSIFACKINNIIQMKQVEQIPEPSKFQDDDIRLFLARKRPFYVKRRFLLQKNKQKQQAHCESESKQRSKFDETEIKGKQKIRNNFSFILPSKEPQKQKINTSGLKSIVQPNNKVQTQKFQKKQKVGKLNKKIAKKNNKVELASKNKRKAQTQQKQVEQINKNQLCNNEHQYFPSKEVFLKNSTYVPIQKQQINNTDLNNILYPNIKTQKQKQKKHKIRKSNKKITKKFNKAELNQKKKKGKVQMLQKKVQQIKGNYLCIQEHQWHTNKQNFYNKCFEKILDLQKRKYSLEE